MPNGNHHLLAPAHPAALIPIQDMRITFCYIVTLLYKANAQGVFEAWEHSVYPFRRTAKRPPKRSSSGRLHLGAWDRGVSGLSKCTFKTCLIGSPCFRRSVGGASPFPRVVAPLVRSDLPTLLASLSFGSGRALFVAWVASILGAPSPVPPVVLPRGY